MTSSDPPCLHCLLGPILLEYLEANTAVTTTEIVHRLTELIADFVADCPDTDERLRLVEYWSALTARYGIEIAEDCYKVDAEAPPSSTSH